MNRIVVLTVLVLIAAVVIVMLPKRDVVDRCPPAAPEKSVAGSALGPPVGTNLEVVALYPPEDLALGDSILVYFNEALAPFNRGADGQAIAFKTYPQLAGNTHFGERHIRFTAPNIKTVFDNPQVSHLEIQLHENLRSVSGQGLAPAMRRHVFVAPPPVIAGALVEEITDDNARVSVTFTRAADLSRLADFISVTDANRAPVDFLVSGAKDAHQAMLTVPFGMELPLNIDIAAGLPWADGRYTAASMQLRYPGARKIGVPYAILESGAEPYIDLHFYQFVLLGWLERLVTVRATDSDEPIPFTLAPNPRQATVAETARLMLSPSEKTMTLEEVDIIVSPWLRAADGDRHFSSVIVRAKRPADETVAEAPPPHVAGWRRRPFGLSYHYWETDMADGISLQLNFSHSVNIDELLENVEITPPVDLRAGKTTGWRHGIRVNGAFESEREYVLRVAAGLKDVHGEVILHEDASFSLGETPLQQGASFDMTHLYYFPRRDMAPPALRARNISEATVRVAQIFPSNLPVFVRDFSSWGAQQNLLTQYAKEICRETVTFPDTRDALLHNTVNLQTLLPSGQRGVYMLAVDPGYDYRDDCRVVVYTDIGALTQWTDAGLVLFAHNLFTMAPIVQAQVTVYSDKFQPIGGSHTDASGIARFTNFEHAYGAPALAIIETDNDYTFVDLRNSQDTKTKFTASMPRYDEAGYDAYIYFDRNLYRPGETVHIRWVVRTRYVDAASDVPFQLRVANPQGRWIYETVVTPSSFGTGGMTFQTEQAYPTGRYRVELRVPEAPAPTGSATFNLEEFVPNRMRAEASFDVDRLTAGCAASIQVKAENLFGGPAVGRKTEARVYLRPTTYTSEAWPGYHFGNEDELEDHLLPLGEAVTDENGEAIFSYTFETPSEATMPIEVILGARVFEVGGRAVSDSKTIQAFPFDIMLGLAASPRHDAEMLDVHVAAITPDDGPADLAGVQVTLEREEWNYHARRLHGRSETRWERAFRQVRTYDIALTDGKGTLQLPYPSYGKYRLRVHASETRMYSMLLFDRWWGRLQIASSSRPDLIHLTVDKERYEVGDEVHLRIESPYDGKAFLLVQGEQILDQMVVPVSGGEGCATFIVPSRWFPNAWIQATVVRDVSIKEGTQYPYSSFAMVNVPLDMPERRIATALLGVPDEIRPSESFTMGIETRNSAGEPVTAEVTVAAVDEGIHGILGYDNPNPYDWFQRSRRFDVLRAHYYENVFFDSESPPIGGDIMRRLGIASQVGENWIKPVALWSGAVKTDDAGRAVITFDVPEFIGQLRLVAVAVNEEAVGAAAASTYVRRPYILQTGMPRFALPGDRFECAALAINMTVMPVSAQLRWNASGALSGSGEKLLEVAGNSDAAWRMPIVAGAAPGQGVIDWELIIIDSGGSVVETLTERAPIPVGSPAAYQTETEIITLAPGETRLIENTWFVDEPALHTVIQAAGMPLWRLYPGLRYLLQYPYGCVEQVTSRVMPLYLLRNYSQMYANLLPEDQGIDAHVVDTYIRHAIERLFLMQTSDGGLGTWPGAMTSYPYASVYALHFLTLVRRDRSYTVYDNAFEALQQYVLGIMRNERHYSKIPSDYYLRAYACYVLALDGNLEAIEYASRFDHVPVPLSARYLLAAAKTMHAQTVFDLDAYLRESPVSAWDTHEQAGVLHSSHRADAVKLMALAQMKAAPARMHQIAESLLGYFEGQRYYSTQEAGFVVTALGLYLEEFGVYNPDQISARITAADGEHILTGNDVFERNLLGQTPRFEISNTGSTPIFVNLEMSGLPLQPRTSPVQEELRVRRDYLHETGEPVLGNTFVHGGHYIVVLTIKPLRDVQNLLITDLLPAGFEIANPRLEPQIQPDAPEEQPEDTIFTPAHLEVRDDRIALAVDKLKGNKEYAFRYLVRVVTPGTFQLPALHAECMYQPAIHAATVPGEIVVE